MSTQNLIRACLCTSAHYADHSYDIVPRIIFGSSPIFGFKPATQTFWASVVNIMPWTLQDNGVGSFGGVGVWSRLEVSSSDEEMADGDGGRGPTDR